MKVFYPNFKLKLNFLSGFGCAGNAFSYSVLHSQGRGRRSCADLDSFNLLGEGECYNPNIFPDTDNIKDNRLQSVFGDTEKNVNNKELIKSAGELLVNSFNSFCGSSESLLSGCGLAVIVF